jgi:hypothetical protein
MAVFLAFSRAPLISPNRWIGPVARDGKKVPAGPRRLWLTVVQCHVASVSVADRQIAGLDDRLGDCS